MHDKKIMKQWFVSFPGEGDGEASAKASWCVATSLTLAEAPGDARVPVARALEASEREVGARPAVTGVVAAARRSCKPQHRPVQRNDQTQIQEAQGEGLCQWSGRSDTKPRGMG